MKYKHKMIKNWVLIYLKVLLVALTGFEDLSQTSAGLVFKDV
jgi:hypothetical protein